MVGKHGQQTIAISMTTDGSVNAFRSSGFTMEHHVSIYLTNKHHVTLLADALGKCCVFFYDHKFPSAALVLHVTS